MTQEAKILIGIGITTILILAGGVFLTSRSFQQTTSEALADKKILIRNDNQSKGSESAKINIVEFADYQCPACGQVYPTIKKLLDNYQGEIFFVYRNFPLPQHKNAILAAKAAEAAGNQGKFWEMHDKIFENQDFWAESDKALDSFLKYAKDLNLDVKKFEEDIKSNQILEKINRDINDGNDLGVNSTPTFFINQKKIVGYLSLEEFKKIIDQKLSEK